MDKEEEEDEEEEEEEDDECLVHFPLCLKAPQPIRSEMLKVEFKLSNLIGLSPKDQSKSLLGVNR